MGVKDYYQILGVNENVNPEEIKKVYRRLAKQYHPDANSGNKQAENRFKEVSEAYQVLSDTKKRQQYDQMRKFGMGGQGCDFGNFDFRGFGGAGRPPKGGFSFEGYDVFGGLGNIFSQFFDSGQGNRRRDYGPRRAKNISVEIFIPFDLSVTGGKTEFSIDQERTCPSCKGGGAKPGSQVQTCTECRGLGRVSIAQGGFGVSRPCPKCYGRGQIITNPCERCHGSGQVRGKRIFRVKIPSSINDGKQIRLKGQGIPGTAAGPAGDIIVNVRVKPHHFFKREGNDINCEIPLDLEQVVNGSRVRVKTVHGKKVQLRIPPGTQDGTILRLAGMGISSNGRSGDQFVTIRIQIPNNPTKEEEALMTHLEEMSKK